MTVDSPSNSSSGNSNGSESSSPRHRTTPSRSNYHPSYRRRIAVALLLTLSIATLCVQFKAMMTTPTFNDQQQHPQQWALYPTSGVRVLPILTENRVRRNNNNDDNVTFGAAITNRLNWTTYERIIETGDEAGLLEFARQVYLLAFDFATLVEPKAPIHSACHAPPLTRPTPAQCSPSVSSVFTNRVRLTPRRVGHALQLGFDIDTLEIHLRELADVVDKFFVVEWTMPHNRRLAPKPLAWEAVKNQERFAFLRNTEQVVHIVMDDVDTAYTDPHDPWSVEALQEQRRWEKIVEWNNQTAFFRDDDLIGFGDTDEIPSRTNVHLLKYCEWRDDEPVDVGIWFPMGRIDQAFRTDYPVSEQHPYSVGDPTFYLFAKAQTVPAATGKAPTRNRGDSPHAILGGAHFSHYGYFLYQLLKALSCTECDYNFLRIRLAQLHSAVQTTGQWHKLEWEASQMQPNWAARTISLDQMDPAERKRLVYLPWFYDCNRDRYSMWEGRPDSRIA